MAEFDQDFLAWWDATEQDYLAGRHLPPPPPEESIELLGPYQVGDLVVWEGHTYRITQTMHMSATDAQLADDALDRQIEPGWHARAILVR